MRYLTKLIKLLSITGVLLFSLISLPSQAGVISGYKWGSSTLGTSGGEVSWSLMDSEISCNGTFEPDACSTSALSSFMPSGFLTELERAFSLWSSIADITFNRVEDGGEPFGGTPSADIRIAGHDFDGPYGVLAHAYYPTGANVGGDVHFDQDENWGINNTSLIDIFTVAVHEIGHAIGIGHSSNTSAVMYSQYSGIITGLHDDDIATAQAIYGPAQIQNTVPEPSSIVLFMSMVGLLLVNKRKQN